MINFNETNDFRFKITIETGILHFWKLKDFELPSNGQHFQYQTDDHGINQIRLTEIYSAFVLPSIILCMSIFILLIEIAINKLAVKSQQECDDPN